MPTYEYVCPEGHEFEYFYRSISAASAELVCPTCGRTGLRKVSGGAGLVFKGSGFYITDYGKDGKKDQKKPSADSKPAAGGEGSSASKPDAPSSSPPKSDPKPSGGDT